MPTPVQKTGSDVYSVFWNFRQSQMALAVFFVLLRGTQVLELEHSDHTTYLSGKDYQW